MARSRAVILSRRHPAARRRRLDRTAARTYGKVVEDYTLLRFPARRVRFVNSGRGGDMAAGGLGRLESDVFARGATAMVVAYGINDIGWGTKADEEHKKIDLDAIRGIVERCKKHGVCVFVCSTAVTAEEPDRAEDGFLWDAQAAALIRLTDARGEVVTARRFADLDLPAHPDAELLHEQAEQADARIETLQRTLVRPRPFHFVARPAVPESP